MLLRTELGVARAEKTYKGMACKTNLRTRRLAKLRVRKVQELSLFSRDVRRPSQELLWSALSMRGTPGYLDGREPLLKPRMRTMKDWMALGVIYLISKNKED